MDDEALPRKILAGELHHVKLWLVCVAHRGVSWNKMPFQQRQLAFQAKDAASNCLSNLLDSHTYIRAQRPFPALRRTDLAPRTPLASHACAMLVMAAFSGLFLFQMANLFPAELNLGATTVHVEQLAQH